MSGVELSYHRRSRLSALRITGSFSEISIYRKKRPSKVTCNYKLNLKNILNVSLGQFALNFIAQCRNNLNLNFMVIKVTALQLNITDAGKSPKLLTLIVLFDVDTLNRKGI